MDSVKRLEIIASSAELAKLTEKLDAVGVPGYSIMRNVAGKGHDGKVSTDSDFTSSALSNVYILSFCSAEQIEDVLARIQPVLKRYGGVCYFSDAMKMVP